jgi:hypothetical protein
MSQVKLAENKRRRGLWPVMGLLLALALGAISYLIAPSVEDAIKDLLPQFSTSGMPASQVRIVFTLLTFVVLISFAALFVALFMPKRPLQVRESDLKKERDQMIQAKKAEKVRQRKINIETQRQLREKNRRGE